MGEEDIMKKSGRESITHNVVQIGGNNKLLTDLPDVANAFKTAIAQHNDNSMHYNCCLLYTSPSPRDRQKSRMPSSA